MTTPIFIRGGPSPHGWSKHADFRLCWRWGAWRWVAGIKFPPGEPLARGILMASAMSHLRAQEGARVGSLTYAGKRQTDPSRFMDPHTAIDYSVEHELRDIDSVTRSKVQADAHRMLDVYKKQPGCFPIGHRILFVEEVVWAWIEDPEQPGVEYPFTSRPDMITEDVKGRIWWWDDKVAANPDAKLISSYSFSGQFVGARWTGPRAWPGRFGGIQLSLTRHDGTFYRPPIKPVPALVSQWPVEYARVERERARLVALKTPAVGYQAAMHDQVCVRRYGGLCPAADLCGFRLTDSGILPDGEGE